MYVNTNVCVYESKNGSVSVQSCPTLSDPIDCSPPSRILCPWNYSRQEYWSGLPFLSPGDLPNPGIEPESPVGHQGRP